MAPNVKQYLPIGIPGPRGPAGPPGGADLGFANKTELEARIVELVVETAPEPAALEQVITDVNALKTSAVKTINGQTPDVSGNVTVAAGVTTAAASTSIVVDQSARVYDPLTITGPTTINVSGTYKGGSALMVVIANGTNIPTISGGKLWGESFPYNNVNGAENQLYIWHNGVGLRYVWSQEANAAVSTPAPAPVAAPGAPTALTVGTPTQTSVPLSWTAPSTGGATTDYVVQFSATGANNWTTFADGTSTTTSATVTGLTAGTAYDFRVAATNAGGTSAYATLTNVSTASASPAPAPAAPAAPTALTAGTPTQTSVPLSWTAPASGGTPTDYIVERSAAGANSWTVFADGTSTATSTTVTGLTAATSYDFRVAATNAGGTSSYATLSNVTTAAASATPQAITTTAMSGMSGPAAGEVYSGTGAATTDPAIGQVAGRLPAGVTGWIQAQHPNTTDASFSLGLDVTNGLTPLASCDFLAACATNGNFQSGENSTSVAISPAYTLTGTANSLMRLYRDGATGVVTQESSTDGGTTWTVRKTYTATNTGELFATIHTVGLRKLYQPRTVGFVA